MFLFRKTLLLFFVSFSFLFCTPSLYDHFLRLGSSDEGDHEEDRFYIRLDEDAFLTSGKEIIPYELSSEDDFDLSDCGINTEENRVSSEDKYCILDVNEMDLLGTEGDALPFVLEYNVPRQTCEYTSFYIPWHFNQLVGEGPPALLKCTVKTLDSGGDDEAKEEKIYYNSINLATATASRTSEHINFCDSITTSSEQEDICLKVFGGFRSLSNACTNTNPDGTPAGSGWVEEDDRENFLSNEFCGLYDLSGRGEQFLSNCCFGEYRLFSCTGREEAGGDPGTCEGNGEQNEWGGNLKECIGGPLRVNNWESNIPRRGLGDYPIPKIVPSWGRGLKDQIELVKGIIVDSGVRNTSNVTIHPRYFSIGVSTYYEGIKGLEWNDSCSDCPKMFKSAAIPSLGNQQLLAYPYFTLECLDAGGDALHRVHLIIREWNTFEEFSDFQDSDGDRGDPDISGTEGEECQYYEPDEFGDNDCNDLFDLDDVMSERDYPHVQYEAGGN